MDASAADPALLDRKVFEDRKRKLNDDHRAQMDALGMAKLLAEEALRLQYEANLASLKLSQLNSPTTPQTTSEA